MRLSRLLTLSNYLGEVHRLSGYSISPRALGILIKLNVAQSIASLVSLITLAQWLFPWLKVLLISLTIASLASLASVFAYVAVRLGIRRSRFERSLVHALLVLTPLLASGATLMEAVHALSRSVRDPEVAGEFRLILREVHEGGLDMLEAIRRSIERVPSESYRDLMNLLIEAYRVVGNVADIMLLKLDNLLKRRQTRLRASVQSMSMILEAYVAIGLLLPMLLVMVSVSLSPLGPLQLGPVSVDAYSTVIFTFVLYVPMTSLAFYLLISSVAQGDELT